MAFDIRDYVPYQKREVPVSADPEEAMDALEELVKNAPPADQWRFLGRKKGKIEFWKFDTIGRLVSLGATVKAKEVEGETILEIVYSFPRPILIGVGAFLGLGLLGGLISGEADSIAAVIFITIVFAGVSVALFKKQFKRLETGVAQLLGQIGKSYEAFREMELPGVPPPLPPGALSDAEMPPVIHRTTPPPPPVSRPPIPPEGNPRNPD